MILICPKIVERDTRVIPVQEQVAVALQFLATGDSYTSLQYLWRICKQLDCAGSVSSYCRGTEIKHAIVNHSFVKRKLLCTYNRWVVALKNKYKGNKVFIFLNWTSGRSHWPRGLRRRSSAAWLLRVWMFVCCECCVLSGRGLCDELKTRPEKSYRMWCVVVCSLDTSKMKRPCPAFGRSFTGGKNALK